MIELAVLKSLRSIETVIAVASSTGTWIFLCIRHVIPALIYGTERATVISVRTELGTNSCFMPRQHSDATSLSSKSRFRARLLCSGASACSLA